MLVSDAGGPLKSVGTADGAVSFISSARMRAGRRRFRAVWWRPARRGCCLHEIAPSCLRPYAVPARSEALGHPEKILPIGALGELAAECDQLILRDPPGVERDLLRAGDPEALPLLEGANEFRGFHEAVRGACV